MKGPYSLHKGFGQYVIKLGKQAVAWRKNRELGMAACADLNRSYLEKQAIPPAAVAEETETRKRKRKRKAPAAE